MKDGRIFDFNQKPVDHDHPETPRRPWPRASQELLARESNSFEKSFRRVMDFPILSFRAALGETSDVHESLL